MTGCCSVIQVLLPYNRTATMQDRGVLLTSEHGGQGRERGKPPLPPSLLHLLPQLFLTLSSPKPSPPVIQDGQVTYQFGSGCPPVNSQVSAGEYSKGGELPPGGSFFRRVHPPWEYSTKLLLQYSQGVRNPSSVPDTGAGSTSCSSTACMHVTNTISTLVHTSGHRRRLPDAVLRPAVLAPGLQAEGPEGDETDRGQPEVAGGDRDAGGGGGQI